MERSSASSETSISRASCEITGYYTAIDVTPRSSSSHRKTVSSMEIINEISQLEHEIEYLERYILSLYRSTFQKHLQTSTENQISPRVSVDSREKEKSQGSRCITFTNDPTPVNRLSNSIFGKVTSPSGLSEDIIRCIASMYCKSASQKQTKSSSSSKTISSRPSCYSRNSWSPQYVDGLDFEFAKPEERPYSSMFEVSELASDNETPEDTMLQQLRFLVKNLEYIDPQTMRHEEKLAFWINIHNALVMHGYLKYGTQSYTRCNMVMQASYNVGGTLVTPYDIRDFILGISRSRSSTPWLQALVSLRKKHRKKSSGKHAFAILKPEPLAHFGLSTGMNSDPAVRVYRGGRVLEDLKRAREEFIRSNVEFDERKELVRLPKMLRYYARDARIPVNEVVNECCDRRTKFMKQVWLEPDSSFRYLIHPNVVYVEEEEEEV